MFRNLLPGRSHKRIVEVSETTVYKCVAFGVKITTDVCEYYTASLIGVIVPQIHPF